MALDGGVLTVHKKKRSRTNGQHITTFRYTLRKPETLTMLAWICSQKLNVVDLPPFSIRSPSSIRSPFPPQKCRSKRPASVSF
ncbi:hypothetical protein M3Y94_00442600 [Aphelenchoides besseyi]|nr:hypothetical protein M3Y94_00442600 [Aphelenchoides besseyi]